NYEALAHPPAIPSFPTRRSSDLAQREDAVEETTHRGIRAVTNRRQVRDQTHEPERQRNRKVGTYREHVPRERAAELRPHVHLVGDRKSTRLNSSHVKISYAVFCL